MAWHARLSLGWQLEAGRTVARFGHDGPLRILKSLWPEGDAICHNVLVHPPGGLVGGDTLSVSLTAASGAHGLITTPGAARFYRSEGAAAVQETSIRAEPGARIEWLPLESIYHPGCDAVNRLGIDLAPGAEMIGWDIAALGLPLAAQPFTSGRVRQHIDLQGAWLEKATIDALDERLLDGPLGFAGHRCLATLYFAAGSEIARDRRAAALDAARSVIGTHALAGTAGATAPNDRVIVVRALAPVVEPAIDLLKAIRRAWRPLLWNLSAVEPRGWTI